jgi:hypothetical protein
MSEAWPFMACRYIPQTSRRDQHGARCDIHLDADSESKLAHPSNFPCAKGAQEEQQSKEALYAP